MMESINLMTDPNKRKTPIVKIDSSLNQFDGQVLFPEIEHDLKPVLFIF